METGPLFRHTCARARCVRGYIIRMRGKNKHSPVLETWMIVGRLHAARRHDAESLVHIGRRILAIRFLTQHKADLTRGIGGDGDRPVPYALKSVGQGALPPFDGTGEIRRYLHGFGLLL